MKLRERGTGNQSSTTPEKKLRVMDDVFHKGKAWYYLTSSEECEVWNDTMMNGSAFRFNGLFLIVCTL